MLDEDSDPREILDRLDKARKKILALRTEKEELEEENARLRWLLRKHDVEIPDNLEDKDS